MAMISKNAKQPMEGMASASMPSMTADGSNGPNVTGGMKKGQGSMNEGAPKVGGGYRTGDNIPGKEALCLSQFLLLMKQEKALVVASLRI